MALTEYKRKRHFNRTPEPAGKIVACAGRSFVIQKHAARNLHYDFRLELDGVLRSWAVPKGPCLDPSVKRLAMQVEDHPVEYGSFEGVIPEGEYGGGTVMLWDTGTWIPEDPEVDAALRKGDLKFTLKGKKLKGSWVLVRTRGFGRNARRSSWLLIKHRDQYASKADVIAEMPTSVSTGRLLRDIAADMGGDVAKARKGDAAGKTSA